MNAAGVWIAVAAVAACSATEKPRHQLAASDEARDQQRRVEPEPAPEVEPDAPGAEIEPEPEPEPEIPWDARAESSDQLAVWGAPPAGRVADYRSAVARVRARVERSADRFDLVFEPPFVVIGDEGRRRVTRRAARTVRWAVQRLKKAYFPRDPDKPLEIWLFGSRASYRRNTKALWGDEPDTPYGYYSPSDGALVMNIATGGGTLIHEIVHPFVEANVPDAPPWLNEGMGSLYEAASERDGHIIGVLNWRLPGLQAALRAGQVPTFRELTSMNANRFYGAGSGVHYAQARYLLYYLQERDLLHRYYKEFLSRRKDDKTGYQALVAILGERDMAAFEKRWSKWVRRLRYRR